MTDLLQRQIELEQEMRAAGAARFRSQLAEARRRGQESTLGGGFRLLQRAVEPLAKAIEEMIADAKGGKAGPRHTAVHLLDAIDPYVAAFVAARVVLDAITFNRVLQKTAIAVGSAIEDEVRFATFEKIDAERFEHTLHHLRTTTNRRHRRAVMVFQANRAGVAWDEWPQQPKLHLGVKLIELMIESTGLIRLELSRNSAKGRGYRIVPNEGVIEWLEEANSRCAFLSPSLMPCVVPPKPWVSPFNGGYHTNAVERRMLVKTGNRAYLEELSNAEMPLVYRAVNAIQATSWKINRRVLDVAKALWDADQGAGIVLPGREAAPLPAKPAWLVEGLAAGAMTEAQKTEFVAWKRAASAAHGANARQVSRRIQAARLLSTADRFAQEAAIWFPHCLDFRGRVYSIPAFLSPQGSDLSRGLLLFGEGKPINDHVAAGWLAVCGANLWGADKVSFDDRIAWVEANEDRILAIAADPLEERSWFDADSPWQFLAWCLEWAAFQATGLGYVSSFPVALDGSCNGIQHYSAMLRDAVGGEAVNLVPKPTPSDIYQRVADVVVADLKAERQSTQDAEEAATIDRLLTLGINRKITKRPVMVLPYGGTFLSCREYVLEALEEVAAASPSNPWVDNSDQRHKDGIFLAVRVWRAIGQVVIGARTVMAWLQSTTRIAAKLDLPVNWVTPSGFPVQQAYRETKDTRVKTKLQDSVVFLKLAKDGPRLDARRQVSGVAPNFVHSHDASALCGSVDMALDNGVTHFAMVHDSYGTHAADTEVLSRCLRHAFADMYLGCNPLEDFQSSIKQLVRGRGDEAELPPIPPAGDLNLSEVLASDYFFA